MPHDFTDVEEGAWFAPFAGVVSEFDLFPNRDSALLSPAREMTRGEVAVAIYKMIVPKEDQVADDLGEFSKEGVSYSPTTLGSPSLIVSTENQNAQMAMTFAGKESELVMPLRINLENARSATIKNLHISFSNRNFVDEIWVKNGKKTSTVEKSGVIIPVNIDFPGAEILDIYVSVRQGLAQGDRVKISLDKIDWEINGEIKTEDFPLDGYELMVF